VPVERSPAVPVVLPEEQAAELLAAAEPLVAELAALPVVKLGPAAAAHHRTRMPPDDRWRQ
jgi:hypothetical protein